MKPYTDRKGVTSEADRYVANQPLVFKESSDNEKSGSTKTVFNLRKMNELPHHLCKTCTPQNMDQLKSEVLCNFDWLYEKTRALGIMR